MTASTLERPTDSPDELDRMRGRMMSIAYRMLGSVVDAEDAVQDAFLRLQASENIQSPEGFLVRATTRRCIDALRTRRRRTYIGPWLPEPVDTHTQASDMADSLTQAFLLVLERLTPNERAALLLRVVFDYEYAAIAEVVQKSEAAVRQLVSRARQRIGLDQQRFAADSIVAEQLAQRFLAACRAGDLQHVEHMLATEMEVHSDGGGKVFAARVVIRGPQRAAKFLVGVFRKMRPYTFHPATVNGTPGVVVKSGEKIIQVMSICAGSTNDDALSESSSGAEQRITSVYITRNPEKLTRWRAVEIT